MGLKSSIWYLLVGGKWHSQEWMQCQSPCCKYFMMQFRYVKKRMEPLFIMLLRSQTKNLCHVIYRQDLPIMVPSRAPYLGEHE